jgi:hypothetical protein
MAKIRYRLFELKSCLVTLNKAHEAANVISMGIIAAEKK